MDLSFNVSPTVCRRIESNRKFVTLSFQCTSEYFFSFLGKGIEQRWGVFTNLQHRSSWSVERFHACEVPSGKFLHINHAIFVDIKIDQSCIKLLSGQWMTEFGRELSKLFLINFSASISIKLSEGFCNIILLLGTMQGNTPFYSIHHGFSSAGVISFV